MPNYEPHNPIDTRDHRAGVFAAELRGVAEPLLAALDRGAALLDELTVSCRGTTPEERRYYDELRSPLQTYRNARGLIQAQACEAVDALREVHRIGLAHADRVARAAAELAARHAPRPPAAA